MHPAPTSRLHWSWLATLAVMAGLAGLITTITLQDDVTRLRIIREGSWVELTSAILWFGVAGIYVAAARRELLTRWHLACLPLLAGLRELDFHVRFNGESIFNGGTYSDPEISAGYKLYSVAAITLILVTALRTLLRDVRPFLSGLRGRQREAWLLACALSLLTVAKLIDGLRGRAQDAPWDLPWTLLDMTETAEEVLELGAPMVVAIAITAGWRMAVRGSEAS